MKNGKRETTVEIRLLSQKSLRTFGERENYLEILKAKITQIKIKEKIRKLYFRRIRKFLETKLSSRNLIKEINSWAVPFVRYSGLFLKWTKEELRQMEKRRRKLLSVYKA